MPTPAWRALASAVLTTRRVPVIDQISARSATVMAHFIEHCPDGVSFYVDLYFGIHEATPEMVAGRLWISNPKRLEDLCVFLRRGGFTVVDAGEWTVLTRRKR